MVAANQQRAHGQTAAEENAHELGKDLTKPADHDPVVVPVGLTRAFQRMRTDWNSKDREIIQQVKDTVESYIFDEFSDAFGIEYENYDLVRAPEIDKSTGEIKVDPNGLTVWALRPDGSYIEDWTKIRSGDRERLLYQIVTKMFQWEQRVADIKGEAMFAKALWEEAFVSGFDAAPDEKKIEAARTAYGNKVSADHRYLAVYKSMVLEKVQAIVRSMDRLCQRLKDLHV